MNLAAAELPVQCVISMTAFGFVRLNFFSPVASEQAAAASNVFCRRIAPQTHRGRRKAAKTGLFASVCDRVSITLDCSAQSPDSCHGFSTLFCRFPGTNATTSRAEAPTPPGGQSNRASAKGLGGGNSPEMQ